MHQSDPSNPIYRRFLDPPPGAPPVHKWHHYFDAYLDALRPFLGRPVTMLEIGVSRGGSLWMWRDVLAPGSRLVGIDIEEAARDGAPEGVPVFIGDQADPGFLRHVVAEAGVPDIVLDDGGHTMRQMIVSFETLYPLMPSPSVYMIEDTHTAFRGRHYRDDPEGRTIYDLAFEVCLKLQEWSGPRENVETLRTPPARRGAPLPVSEICRMTRSVAFHDSMITFHRAARPEPWVQARRGAGQRAGGNSTA